MFPLYQACCSPESFTTKCRCVSTHPPSRKESSSKQLDANLKKKIPFLSSKGFILNFYSDLEPLNAIILPRILLIIHDRMSLLQESPLKRSVHLAKVCLLFSSNWNPTLTVLTKGNFWWSDTIYQSLSGAFTVRDELTHCNEPDISVW